MINPMFTLGIRCLKTLQIRIRPHINLEHYKKEVVYFSKHFHKIIQISFFAGLSGKIFTRKKTNGSFREDYYEFRPSLITCLAANIYDTAATNTYSVSIFV